MYSASDFGFSIEGQLPSQRLDFDTWASRVDQRICEITGAEANEVEASYAEYWLMGLGIEEATTRALELAHLAMVAS